MRVDLNVPLQKGRLAHGADFRFKAPLDDIQQLRKRGVCIILVTHVGRPEGRRVAALSTKPLAKKMARLLKAPVKHVPAVVGKQVEAAVHAMKEGDVLMLENVRFELGEKMNGVTLAKQLAKNVDLYINNAFGVCHRKHASVHAITKYVESCAGSVLTGEVSALQKKLEDPFVLILGGMKLKTKIGLLQALAPKAKAVLLGSGVASVLHGAKDSSKIDLHDYEVSKEELLAAKKVLKTCGKTCVFPIDVAMTKTKSLTHVRDIPLKMLDDGERAVDLGKHTIELYRRILLGAGSVVWNGPVGVVESAAGQKGTVELAKTIQSLEARSIIGGGDTLTFLEKKKLTKGFSFLSTGGGAMLALLAGETLPGLEVLRK